MTTFSFQISDHSRECTKHHDPALSLSVYESCAVHGGDGFAFVIHGDDRGTEALGADGASLGYAGLRNSLAIEFDTGYNPEPTDRETERLYADTLEATAMNARVVRRRPGGTGDLVTDHLSVHSAGTGRNTASRETELGEPAPVDLADGKVHVAKVEYRGSLATEYVANFTATPALTPYLMDFDESRRLGTLIVWLDEGIENDAPLFAIPMNLAVLLKLRQDVAHVGFTAATGDAWEKHDVLSWLWCDAAEGCGEGDAGAFDYHSEAKHNVASGVRTYAPGKGYGNGGGAPASVETGGTRHTSPSTHHVTDVHPGEQDAGGKPYGLADGAGSQVPPGTAV